MAAAAVAVPALPPSPPGRSRPCRKWSTRAIRSQQEPAEPKPDTQDGRGQFSRYPLVFWCIQQKHQALCEGHMKNLAQLILAEAAAKKEAEKNKEAFDAEIKKEIGSCTSGGLARGGRGGRFGSRGGARTPTLTKKEIETLQSMAHKSQQEAEFRHYGGRSGRVDLRTGRGTAFFPCQRILAPVPPQYWYDRKIALARQEAKNSLELVAKHQAHYEGHMERVADFMIAKANAAKKGKANNAEMDACLTTRRSHWPARRPKSAAPGGGCTDMVVAEAALDEGLFAGD
ncbi:hypothetical protein PGQ11_001352 [Apiospora arundinis]|uniref:Uncharacterized protein n=1 Tax=Apiospora arundinis TaxID=335852 RepID=A0ABR2JMT1_9PEZI